MSNVVVLPPFFTSLPYFDDQKREKYVSGLATGSSVSPYIQSSSKMAGYPFRPEYIV